MDSDTQVTVKACGPLVKNPIRSVECVQIHCMLEQVDMTVYFSYC